jgi:MFS family permease
MSENPPAGLTTPMRRADFRSLWLAQTISDLGDGLTSLTLMLLALRLGQSSAAVAAVLIAIEVPQVTIGLAAGVLVDRWERRRVMLVSDAVRALLVLGFVGVASVGALWLLVALTLAQASVGTFFSPARTAMVATVLPADELFAANSLGQLSRVLSTVVGAGAAGILVGVFGQYWPAFVLDAATFAASVALVSRVRARSVRRPDEVGPGMRGELAGGLTTIRRSPVLLGTLVATATAMLGIGAVNVLWVPLFVSDLHVPTVLFGTADLAQAAALIMGAAFAVRLVGRVGPTQIIAGGLAALGMTVALVGGVTAFWQVLALFFVVGWIVSPLQAAVSTVVQTAVPDASRGRTAAALGSVTSSANILSMALAGAVSGAIGVRESFVLAGVLIAGSSLVALALFRREANASRGAVWEALPPTP